MNKALQLIVLAGLTAISAHAQKNTNSYLSDPQGAYREHNVDMQHMRLEVSFDTKKGIVYGKATHHFKPLQAGIDSIIYDCPGIKIKSVMLNGKEAKYKQNDKMISIITGKSIQLGELDSTSITYEATPRKGIYFIGWNDSTNTSRKQIWTQGQGTDNRYWYPCYDDMNDKLTTEVIVKFDSAYKVLSNGAKVAETMNTDGSKTWHYRMSHPHANYLLMLGIGKYAIAESQAKSGVKINNWYYPEQPERVEPSYKLTNEMMDFLEKSTGTPYPWEQYSQIPVQEFIYGAMENTTATIFGDFFYVDKRAALDKDYVGVNAHEMTHHWFGDCITARSTKHVWLQESFATHYSKHFMRSAYGEDVYQWGRRQELNTILTAAKENRNPIAYSAAGTQRIYQKGSSVLDMMRYVLTDATYDRVIAAYLKKYMYANVETNDLLQVIQDETGKNLDWFFDQWLYRGGEPTYDVSYRNVNSGGNFNEITVAQTHIMDDLTGVFKMPIVIQVYYADGSMNERKEWIDKPLQTVSIANNENKKVDFVLFDPNSNVIKTLNFKKSAEELKAQLEKAPNMIDRYDALLGLKSTPLSDKRLSLQQAYKQEKFYGAKAEIIAQLSADTDSASLKLVAEAGSDKEAKVRLAVLQNNSPTNSFMKPVFEKALGDSSYDNTELALKKLSEAYPADVSKYLAKTDNQFGMANSLRISWLEIACTQDLQKYIPELTKYSASQYEFRTRINAMNALQRLNYMDKTIALNLFNALLSNNSRLAGPAGKALEYYAKQNASKVILKQAYQSRKWAAWQATAIEKAIN